MKYYSIVLACLTAIAPMRAWADSGETVKIIDIASNSQCAKVEWKGRGKAPRSYIKGMALVFARSICHPEREDVKIVSSAPDAAANANDALIVYRKIFSDAGMTNDRSGSDTLRHSYALLIGLGMMESSGKYCEGRDVSQCFAEADSAEAGLFQTSYGAHVHSKALDALFDRYRQDQNPCLLNTFNAGITCKIRKSHNSKCPDATSDVTGKGPGADWQRLTKSCPAFAAEYGAVVLRTNGGPRGEFNPIRKKQAEVRLECDSMLRQVQDYVKAHPKICSEL